MEPVSLANQNAIIRLLEAFAAGWNEPSGTNLASIFAADADFTNVMGLRVHGRNVIARGHDEILATLFAGTRLRVSVDQIRLVRPDVAVVDATLTLRHRKGLPLAIPGRSKVKCIASKDADRWSIVSFQNMVPIARPTAGPLERELAASQISA